jgi:hypothetical protein
MGVAKAVCQAPLFVAKTLAILSIQPTVVFCLVVTLCENSGTLDLMVRSKDTFVPLVVPHPVYEANHPKVSKVQVESWHVAMAKFHDLPK